MKLKKAICLLAVVGCLVGLSAGCGQQGKSADYLVSEYHASCLNRDEYDMKVDFRMANITNGNWYNFESGEFDYDADIAATLPNNRTHIINQQSQIDDAFNSFPVVDFEKQEVLLYFYTEEYVGYAMRLFSIMKEDDTLTINFLIDAGKKRGYTYAYNFVTTCVIIVIDKISVSNIEFDRTWRYGNLLGGSQWMICER